MSDARDPDEQQRALLGAASVLRGLLAQAAVSEVMARHQVGVLLREVKGTPRTYGERSLERLAKELGIALSTLYRHVGVAEAWTAAQISKECERTNRFGQPLSWSHFVALSRLPDATARKAMLERCLAEGWSSRDLTRHLVARVVAPPSDPNGAGTSAEVALREGIRNAARAAVDVGLFAEALADRAALSGTTADPELLRRAVAAFAELRARADAMLAGVRQAALPGDGEGVEDAGAEGSSRARPPPSA